MVEASSAPGRASRSCVDNGFFMGASVGSSILHRPGGFGAPQFRSRGLKFRSGREARPIRRNSLFAGGARSSGKPAPSIQCRIRTGHRLIFFTPSSIFARADPFKRAGTGGGMIVRWLAVFMLLGSASAARAADWWWVGINGNAPNRVLTYVDRASVRQIGGGAVEVWLLAYGETALPHGQQHQANHWAIKCRHRTLSMLRRIARNASCQRL